MNGTVKFFNESKGFGFITGEDGKEYFVHQTALPQGTRLQENDAVSFDVEQGDRGPKAVNVSMGGSEEAPGNDEPMDESATEEATEESSEESSDDSSDDSAEESDDEEQKEAA